MNGNQCDVTADHSVLDAASAAATECKAIERCMRAACRQVSYFGLYLQMVGPTSPLARWDQ